MIELFSRALNDGDLDGALALYEEDAVLAPQPGAAVTGREVIRDALAGFAAMRPVLSGEVWKVLRAGDTALVSNRWSLRGTAPDGSEVTMEGVSADVVPRRPDGRWLLVIDDPWGAAGAA